MELLNRIGDTGDIQVKAIIAPGIEAKNFSLKIDRWMVGEQPSELIASLGIHPVLPEMDAVIGAILPGKPADLSGLRVNDRVFRVNGKSIKDWSDFASIIHVSAEKMLHIDVYRVSDSQKHDSQKDDFQKHDSQKQQIARINIKPEIYTDDKGHSEGRIGISAKPFNYPVDMIRKVSYGPIDSIVYAGSQVWADSKMTLNAIKKMFQGLISLDNLSGPITIAQVASNSIRSGSEAFLHFLAILSISLGVLNLLPIPVLDGGHIFYYLIEGIRGKPIAEKWQLLGLKIGISFVLLLMSLAFYNDVMRLQQ